MPNAPRLLATLQVEHYYGWDSSVGDAIGRESVEVARRSGDTAVLIEVLLMRVLALYGPGLTEERLLLLDELRTYDLQGELEVFVLFQRGHTLYECGRPDEGDDVMRQCAAAAAGTPTHRGRDPARRGGGSPGPGTWTTRRRRHWLVPPSSCTGRAATSPTRTSSALRPLA